MPIGFTLPFSIASGSTGYFEMTRDELSAVEQNVRSILLTNWGERVGRYYFGCNLRQFMFEPMDVDELKEKIADRITGQLRTWLPFVDIDTLNILTVIDDSSIPENCIKIKIAFSLNSRPDMTRTLEVII